MSTSNYKSILESNMRSVKARAMGVQWSQSQQLITTEWLKKWRMKVLQCPSQTPDISSVVRELRHNICPQIRVGQNSLTSRWETEKDLQRTVTSGYCWLQVIGASACYWVMRCTYFFSYCFFFLTTSHTVKLIMTWRNQSCVGVVFK